MPLDMSMMEKGVSITLQDLLSTSAPQGIHGMEFHAFLEGPARTAPKEPIGMETSATLSTTSQEAFLLSPVLQLTQSQQPQVTQPQPMSQLPPPLHLHPPHPLLLLHHSQFAPMELTGSQPPVFVSLELPQL